MLFIATKVDRLKCFLRRKFKDFNAQSSSIFVQVLALLFNYSENQKTVELSSSSWGYRIIHYQKQFGQDRFSRFDVYWMQTNKLNLKRKCSGNLGIAIVAVSLEDWGGGVQKSLISNHRHPNLFCGMHDPQWVISSLHHLNFQSGIKKLT